MVIHGFVGKPETAKKTRGDQYFFVNNRFIKSAYLNHAVMNAFNEMVGKDSFPMYVLFIDLDPSQLDINVHPTKQEIKFEDEKIVYAFVQSAVKHALAQFSIAPSLDFSLNAEIQSLEAVNKPATAQNLEAVSSSNLYKTFTQKNQAHKLEPTNQGELKHWRDFYAPAKQEGETFEYEKTPGADLGFKLHAVPSIQLLQDCSLTHLHNTYIICCVEDGFLLIHQQQAHERILYERFSLAVNGKQMATQQSLFPTTIELAASDTMLMHELIPDLHVLGYLIEHFGNNTFVLQGTPADILSGNERVAIEMLLEQYKHFSTDIKFGKREKLVRCMAKQEAIKPGQNLSQKEMNTLVEELFSCNTPNITPNGSPTYMEFKGDYLDRMFGK
jgi:DNA mismatch repair protein MutL